jgi:hypothetical protein
MQRTFKLVKTLINFSFNFFEKFRFTENTKWKVRQLSFHLVVMLGKIIIQWKIQLHFYHSTKTAQIFFWKKFYIQGVISNSNK